MKQQFIFISIILVMCSVVFADEPIDKLLSVTVRDGQVDYSYLKKKSSIVESKISEMSKVDLAQYTPNQLKAFWINAYNLATIQLILNHFPLKSIKDIPSADRWLWKGWSFGGQFVSLDQIEHEILRPMGDPRIHFAINCASKSCPILRSTLLKADTIDAQLEEYTREFFKDSERGLRIVRRKSFWGWGDDVDEIYVSKILNWFAEDFVKNKGSLIQFLTPYLDDPQKVLLQGKTDADLRFLEYDWSLNRR